MTKVIDITGQRFDRIVITRRVENDKRGQAMFEYVCDCGTIKIGSGADIRNGKITSCGCKKKERMKEEAKKRKEDITGKTYNDLTAIRFDHYNDNKNSVWLFKCTCGKETLKNKSDVTSGKTTNCGCKTTLLRSKPHRIYEKPGTVYGYLRIDEPAFEENYIGDSIYWCTCLLCGRRIKILSTYFRSGNTKSCGCMSSYQEEKIAEILSNNNINYKKQQTYEDLLSEKGKRLRFDFSISNEKNEILGLIEYQGIQHFDDSHGNFGRQQREVTDQQKVEYCLKNKIPLLILTKENDLEKDILNFYNEVI